MIPWIIGAFVIFVILRFYFKPKIAFIVSAIFFFGAIACCLIKEQLTKPNYDFSGHNDLEKLFKEPVPLRVPNKDD